MRKKCEKKIHRRRVTRIKKKKEKTAHNLQKACNVRKKLKQNIKGY